jgi:2-polyprenyl-6-methoxyphenol hydroxylase-like FAD-dependent oxidoreductase
VPTEVLVVGAGPTGLALALQAHDHGAAVRVVERRVGPRPSRALVVHPRTLECLHPTGVVPELAARADRDPRASLHLGSHEVSIDLDELTLDDSQFRHPWLLRQHDVEEVLAAAVAARGIRVERGTELVALVPGRDDARVALHGPGGPEVTTAYRVVGCDGAEGPVRRLAGIPSSETRYRQEIVLADIELATGLEAGVTHVCAGWAGVVFVFALGERATWRILATRAPRGGGDGPGREDLQRLLTTAGLPGQVTDVAWSARLRLTRRLAATYRRGPVFLAGDAAHTHSPAAAQGMNLGLQDALDLGWKLGFAPSSSDPDRLLDSYEEERRPIARMSAGLTDLVFWAESSPTALAGLLRGVLAPLAAPLVPSLLRHRVLTQPALRLLSGLTINHRHSSLSGADTRRGRLCPGDRLPDRGVVHDGHRVRLHQLIARPGVHVLLARDAPPLPPELVGSLLTVHRLDDRPGRTVLAVRPDGYVGHRSDGTDPAHLDLRAWLDRIGAPTAGGDHRDGHPGRRPATRHPW